MGILNDQTTRSKPRRQTAEVLHDRHQTDHKVCQGSSVGPVLIQESQALEKINTGRAHTDTMFEKVFDTSYLGIAMLDRKLNFLRVNHVFAKNSGHSPVFFQGKNYFSLFPDDVARDLFDRVLETGEPLIEFARPFVRSEGQEKHRSWWDWTVSTVSETEDQADGLLLCMTNVTQRVELERELIQITDREQKRLGRDLHDGMAQLLTAISIKTKILEQTLKPRCPEAMDAIRDISDLLREAAVQTRNLSRFLNPPVVEAQGLAPALQALAEETKRRMNVACEFHGEDPSLSFLPAVAGHLYRITQESITNAIRHGQAKHIHIELLTEKNTRILRISNDGVPFSLTALKTTQGLGTKGMQYRAQSIGANFSIEPDANGHTVVECELTGPILLPSTE